MEKQVLTIDEMTARMNELKAQLKAQQDALKAAREAAKKPKEIDRLMSFEAYENENCEGEPFYTSFNHYGLEKRCIDAIKEDATKQFWIFIKSDRLGTREIAHLYKGEDGCLIVE